MAKKFNLKSRRSKIILIAVVSCVILFGFISTLARRRATHKYELGVMSLMQGDYESAIKYFSHSTKVWPDGWWFEDARSKMLYCRVNTGENIDLLLGESGKRSKESSLVQNFIVIIVALLVIAGVGFMLSIRAKRKKKAQQFLQYIQNIGKRIKSNLPPTCLEKAVDGISSVEDYREYIKHYKDGEFVKLADCLITEYQLKSNLESVDSLNSAVEAYRNLLRDYKDSVFAEEVLYKLANISFFRLNDYNKAVSSYKSIIEKFPESKWVKIARSRVNLVQDNSDYERQPLTMYITAEREYESKKYDKAINSFRKVIEKFPHANLADDALYSIGDIYMYKINDPVHAIREYHQIIESYPQSRYAPNAQYKIGECYRRLKEFANAIGEYEKFIQDYPECDFLDYGYYYLAQCYEQEKELLKAKNLYQKLVNVYPGSMWVVVATSRLEVLKDINEDKKE
ncbi:MAG: tetratricopeptide repeat protein [bacterium]